MNNQDNVFILMGRYLSGESTASEKEQLFSLLAKDEQLQQHFEIYKSLWSNSNTLDTGVVEQDEIQAINRILGTPQTNIDNETPVVQMPPKPGYKWIWAAAACLLIAASGIFFFKNNASQNITSTVHAKLEDSMHVIVSQKGTRSKNQLPDGSIVWLNAGSTLYYKKNFTNNSIREVKLVGEAFFDVVKMMNKPFIVNAPGIQVKVLGTAFNVKSYPDDRVTETTLLRGKVEVKSTAKASSKIYTLYPNQKLVMLKSVQQQASTAVNEQQEAVLFDETDISTITASSNEELLPETSWVQNRLVFKGDSFEQLAKKLERWYNVSIVFRDEQAKQLHFSGSLENETKEQAFEALKAVAIFNYSIKNHEIFIQSHR
jgi:transmembrane sensor